MSKKVIRFALSEKDIGRAIKELESYKKDLQRKIDTIVERLAMIGVQEASIRFATAIYDGVNDSSVSLEPMENGWKIVAEGKAVCFIEFGSGVYHNPSEPYPLPRPSGVVGIGEYDKGKGTQQAWGYYGEPGTNGEVHTNKKGEQVVITHGNPAAMPMWYASQKIQQEVLAIVREVFN